jgi:WD40 repeat protein
MHHLITSNLIYSAKQKRGMYNMAANFLYDVFLAYSSKDKAIVQNITERLHADGIRVWFDEWEINPGDHIASKTEEALAHSRILVLCMSANLLRADWATMELYTFPFRDRQNKDRRFIPLRFDDTVIKGDLAQYKNINWLPEHREQGYVDLITACRLAAISPESKSEERTVANEPPCKSRVFSLGHTGDVTEFVVNADGTMALSCSEDGTIRLWEVQSGKCLRVMEGHEGGILCIAWSYDGVHAISGSNDKTIRLWEVHTGKCLQVMEGHTDRIDSVACSSDGFHILSGSYDKTIRLWDKHTGRCLRVMEGHTYGIISLAFSSDGMHALSGSHDDTLRLWNMHSGQCLKVLEGHTDSVRSVAWSPNGIQAISGSNDKTIRLWEVHSGKCLRVIQEHKKEVCKVAWGCDGNYALSVANDSAQLWEVNTGKSLHVLKIHFDEDINYIIWHQHVANNSIFDSKTIQLWKFRNRNMLHATDKERVRSVAWSPDTAYALTGSESNTIQLWKVPEGNCLRVLKGHSGYVDSIAWSPDGIHALSGSDDGSLRFWKVLSGKCVKVLEGHEYGVRSVGWSPDGVYALSGSQDGTIRLWNVRAGKCARLMQDHFDAVSSIAWSPNGNYALSVSYDQTMRLWEVYTGICLRVMEGHTDAVLSVAWSPDGKYALSGSVDSTIRLWEVQTGMCLHIMEGHKDSVNSIAWDQDGIHALSGSDDHTIRLWEVYTGKCKRIIQGHSDSIVSVQWCAENNMVVSTDSIGVGRFWDKVLQEENVLSNNIIPQHVTYCNTKVLLVGESGVGKTGLSNHLALGIKDNGNNTSTDGAWATQWTLPHTLNNNGIDREIWLWDFAGQVDYRLVHQLFMDETSAAVLVFNPQHENPLEGLAQWNHDLQKASRRQFARLLAAGRVDRGGLIVSNTSMHKFMQERGFIFPLHFTSAKTGEGCIGLRDAILQAIDWEHIPKTTSPALYHNIKREIIQLRDSGMVLIRLTELKQRIDMALPGEHFDWEELLAVIRLLDGPGMIQRLDFGEFILLRPEVLSRYAAAVVRKVRKHSEELGCINEDELLNGELDYQDFERLPVDEEKILLRALHEKLINRAWCLRQPCDGTALLIFPSYFRRERPEKTNQLNIQVTYRFSGPVEDIYATLIVRLHHTEAFESDQLWKDAADFKTQTGQRLGCKLVREAEGSARIEVYFNTGVDENMRLVFARYIHNHLLHYCRNIERLRHYCCTNKRCDDYNQTFTDQDRIDKALFPGGKSKVFCSGCGKPILLRDMMERKFESAEIKEMAHLEGRKSKSNIDNESLELILLGHAYIITAQAGQIFRPTPNSDHGIDGEIEFKDDEGRATGKRLYLQLKSGDSYLVERKRDNAEVFNITNGRWADYWQQQAYPVLLVIRNSKGDIRWMDVSDYLKRNRGPDNKRPRQIIFSGESFDVMSIRRWRDKLLENKKAASF